MSTRSRGRRPRSAAALLVCAAAGCSLPYRIEFGSKDSDSAAVDEGTPVTATAEGSSYEEQFLAWEVSHEEFVRCFDERRLARTTLDPAFQELTRRFSYLKAFLQPRGDSRVDGFLEDYREIWARYDENVNPQFPRRRLEDLGREIRKALSPGKAAAYR